MSNEGSWLECPATGRRLVLEDSGVIGRAQSARLRLEDAGVSREHASLRRKDGTWWIQDMGSANGTFVNGLPATIVTRVSDGDEISFGPARYVFRDPGSRMDGGGECPEKTIVAAPRTEPVLVTLLVADVVGFSELSTRLSSTVISQAMSAWCGHCRTVMHDCGGHIDKFIGDCVFAWWHGSGAAVKDRALQAAKALAAGYPGSRLPDGSALHCGIGLHAGEAALSRLGPSSYTLLGAEVNLTFRIESLTRKLEPMVASGAFASGWPDGSPWSFPSLGTHEIKGWHQPVEVFGVRGA